jgi:23S rRNA (uracil1939-C5)-methyltransferase
MKLRIDKAIYGGSGLGRVSDDGDPLFGKTVFVPFTLPGETVEIHIAEDKRNYATGELDSILESSAARTSPPCPYFGNCGGCHYQHSNYENQLQMKRSILQEALLRARLKKLPEIAVLAANPWAYRNRIRLLVQRLPEFALCYRRGGSHASVAVSQCPIAAPLLQRAINVITEQGSELGLADLCEEIELFTGPADDKLLMSAHSLNSPRNGAEVLEKLCSALAMHLPELCGAALFAHGDDENHGQVLARWGESSLKYHAAGYEYQVSHGSFFQVNRFLIDALAKLVTAERSGTLAWDLYAGVGLFSLPLTASFERLFAVESGATSWADLAFNLQGTSHRTARMTTRDFLRQQTRSKIPQPDLVIVDPPRIGLGDEVCSLLARVAPREIVYVSCDPATLSRDLNALIQSGYYFKSIHLVDLFPQTFHMESVVVLTRS